jgi:hypothetical protein
MLVKYRSPELIHHLLPWLKSSIYPVDSVNILGFVNSTGSSANLPDIMEYIDFGLKNSVPERAMELAFDSIRKFGADSPDVPEYLLQIVSNNSIPANITGMAVRALSACRSLPVLEKILASADSGNESAVFNAVNLMLIDKLSEQKKDPTEEDRLYTYTSEGEDRLILEIRVMLGKFASHFDRFPDKAKTSYISALMISNHREYLIYVMKALTSGNADLSRMVLYAIYADVDRLRDPDKLFRSLISLTTESSRDNDLIVDIFAKYFALSLNTRQFNLLRDKLYSYIVVTFDTYFEMYRKEYMISDVSEKSFSENYQRIRRFLLDKLTPELKKKIVLFLTQDENMLINHMLDEIGSWYHYVAPESEEDLSLLVEVLFESDRKSREIAASRLDDLVYEKRYLKNRIIRLCRIIDRLSITDAAPSLVNTYNYLKKYPEPGLNEVIIHALADLNYSYMLAEMEVQLNTGGDDEQMKALDLISLYSEQRSLNILLEYAQVKLSEDSPSLIKVLSILSERDVSANATACQVFKWVVEKNPSPEAVSISLIGIGRCGFDADLEYLHSLFLKVENQLQKESIVRAMGYIISESPTYNRRQVIKYLHDYLRDPGIRVRIYSCLLLAKLGDKDAIRSIRDMLIIRNRSIQRDLLTILGDLRSLEFSFFLLSLLTEEYGIHRDIVSALQKLPDEDMKEVDSFIFNIFRKFEAPDFDQNDNAVKPAEVNIEVPGLTSSEKTLLRIDLLRTGVQAGSVSGMIDLNLLFKDLIIGHIEKFHGSVASISNEMVVAVFAVPADAASASLEISEIIKNYNVIRVKDRQIDSALKIISGTVTMLNEELIDYPDFSLPEAMKEPLYNRVLLDGRSCELLAGSFFMSPVPSGGEGVSGRITELASPVNFKKVSEAVYKKIVEEEASREQHQLEIEAEMKKMRRESRSPSSVAMAREMENIGSRLREQLDEIEKYVQRRATDRDLIKNVKKMLDNTYNFYKVEISRIIIE